MLYGMKIYIDVISNLHYFAFMKEMYVYIITNRKYGVLYTGVTNDLARRIFVHKKKYIEGFSAQYNLTMLVYYERFEDAVSAIEREKQIKDYRRQKKINLIKKMNPEWKDLFLEICK